MRKVILISGVILIVFILGFLGVKYYPFHEEKPVIQTFSTKQNPAFKAVPSKSPLIIEVKNQDGFFNALKGDKQVLAELRNIPEIEKIFSGFNKFRNFVSSRSGIKNLLSAKSIIVSVNPSGKNQFSSLFLVQMNDQAESNSVADVVSRELGSDFTVSRRNYDNTIIYNARSTDQNFFFACSDDVFMASEDFILIEGAIRQARSQNLLDVREFTEVYKTIEETALANVFINHLTIHQLLAKIVSPEIRKSISQLASYSNWTELDLSVNPSELELNGFSITRDSTDTFLNIFRNQEPQKMTIQEAIPANASYFMALNLQNTNAYIDQYESYLRAKGDYYPREMSLIEFKKKTNTDPGKLMKDISGTQFAAVYTSINKSNPLQNRFFVAELTDRSEARDKLAKAVSEFGKTSKTTEEMLHTKYSVGTKNSFDIYRLPFGDTGESLLGKFFSGISAEYFALFEKYLILGDNLPGMKNYLQSLASEKTMANDSTYQVYIKNGQAKPNIFMYARVPKVFRLKDVLFKPDFSSALSNNEDIIRKYSTFSWQFSVSGQGIKNRINLKYDPNAKEEPQAVWQLKLDGQLKQKPKFVLNHKDLPNREIIVCDKKNNVSLINKEGLVLWTINVPDEIVSEVHQIDIYQTKRFQYLFNTKTQLYVVDRNGNKVGKFPVTLKSIASNGVTVAEYGKNKELRYFVAGEDKKIYVFDRDGKQIPKWNPEPSTGLVTKPIQHIEVGDKDFIVFYDDQNTYFLDRQGRKRDGQPAPFNHSGNPMYFIDGGNPKLISTDTSGKIHLIDFTGQAEIKEVGKFGAGHRFVAGDLDGNGTTEYLFAEGKKLSVFGADGKKLIEKNFPDIISENPIVCSLGSGKNLIGVVIGNENKTYLIDLKGSVINGFPLDGNASFLLGKFNDANSWTNLVVGSEGNSLVNYRIE